MAYIINILYFILVTLIFFLYTIFRICSYEVNDKIKLATINLVNFFFIQAFVKSFSDALRMEYEKDGLTIQHLSPLFVNTKMNAFSHRLQESNILLPDAETYAKSAVNTLGQVNNSTGYWIHGIQVI